MKTMQFLILVTFVAFVAGCATVAPNELINARLAYQHASEGPAEQLAPVELHKASAAELRAAPSNRFLGSCGVAAFMSRESWLPSRSLIEAVVITGRNRNLPSLSAKRAEVRERRKNYG